MFCKKCGEEIDNDIKLCPLCGTVVSDVKDNNRALKFSNGENLVLSLFILGLASPIIGFISAFVYWLKNNKIAKKSSLYGASIGMIFWYIIYHK